MNYLTLLNATGNINFNIDNFVGNLKYMGIGMLSILIVMGALIVITVLLNWFGKKGKKDE